MPYRILEQSGVFTFQDAEAWGEQAFGQIAESWNMSRSFRDRYFDLLMLTAAEAAIALSPARFEELGAYLPDFPVQVGYQEAILSLLKMNSTPTWPHLPSSAADIEWSDVMLFSGDISKVIQVAGRSATFVVERGQDGFNEVMEGLREMYMQGRNSISRAVADSGALELQGLLWYAKTAVIVDPERADENVRRYLASEKWRR